MTFFKNSQNRNASRRLTRSRRRRRNVFRHPDGSMSPLFPDQEKSELTVVIRFSCNCISFSSPSPFFEARDPSCQGTTFLWMIPKGNHLVLGKIYFEGSYILGVSRLIIEWITPFEIPSAKCSPYDTDRNLNANRHFVNGLSRQINRSVITFLQTVLSPGLSVRIFNSHLRIASTFWIRFVPFEFKEFIE